MVKQASLTTSGWWGTFLPYFTDEETEAAKGPEITSALEPVFFLNEESAADYHPEAVHFTLLCSATFARLTMH